MSLIWMWLSPRRKEQTQQAFLKYCDEFSHKQNNQKLDSDFCYADTESTFPIIQRRLETSGN